MTKPKKAVDERDKKNRDPGTGNLARKSYGFEHTDDLDAVPFFGIERGVDSEDRDNDTLHTATPDEGGIGEE